MTRIPSNKSQTGGGNLQKPKLALYWASGCGGCEIGLVNLHERILDVAAAFDFVFCPCLLDTKYQNLGFGQAVNDQEIRQY